MQKNRISLTRKILLSALFLLTSVAQAGMPMWIFEPQTPVELTVSPGNTAEVRYIVRNQSSAPKSLVMRPVAGVTQSSVCSLAPRESCSLTLTINGSALKGDVIGGPVLCEHGNNLQCEQPGKGNGLRIRLKGNPVQQYTVKPLAGTNGSIAPDIAQVVNAGDSITFSATPDAGHGVNHWLLDGRVVQTGGKSFQLRNIKANHTIRVVFGKTTLTPGTKQLSLSVNDANHSSLTGNSRTITLTNNGSSAATGVNVNSVGLPSDTKITGDTCSGTLAAGDSCSITITPGSIASAGNDSNACTTGTAPLAGSVTISASNASQSKVDVLVLGYGCIYQGGYIYAIDDTQPAGNSISGKVVALENQAERFPDGLPWDADSSCKLSPFECNNTTKAWDFHNGSNLEDNGANGPGNTWLISQVLNGKHNNTNAPANYAAGACISYAGGGFTDWYLPAICEMGPGYQCDLGAQNIVDSLGVLIGNPNEQPDMSCAIGSNCLTGRYWSSTELSGNARAGAWYQDFDSNGSAQYDYFKDDSNGVRCTRAFN